MPYIEQTNRNLIWSEGTGILNANNICRIGELNFAITSLLKYYLSRFKPLCYADLNSIVGVLECVKSEFYNRIITPYEQKKIKENGDVY